jgi:anti-anti-sigma regulatory factor
MGADVREGRSAHRGRVGVVVCDLSGVAEPSLAMVEVLARLRLIARRLGYDLRIRGAQPRLRELLVLTGLADIVPIDGDSAGEPHGHPEQWEQPLDVEEVGDRADPAG